MPLKGKKATTKSSKAKVEDNIVATDDHDNGKDENVEDTSDTSGKSPNGEANDKHSEKEVDHKEEEEEEDEEIEDEDDTEVVEKEKKKTKPKGKKRKSEEKEDDEEDGNSSKRPTRGSKRNAKTNNNEPASKQGKRTTTKSSGYTCEKTTTDGNVSNLKISAWNVAGLRAWVKKEGSLDYVLHLEQPDIMILLETKCADHKLPPEVKMPDYQMYTVASEKEGYCGVLLYSKIKPISVQYGIGNKEFDHEGRCITAEFKDFYLVCAYVPNSGQGLKTLPKRLKWNKEFLKMIKSLDEKKPVVLCGDLNVAHEPIDLANPKTNTKNAGYTKEEREDFSKLLSEGFVDTFRQLYPEETGAYTFWSNRGGARSRNVGWRLDYFVMSKRFLPHLCDSLIRAQVLGSDHCPITLCLNV